MKLEVRDLSFGYNRNLILDDISFTLEGNVFCSLIGPNGAGKTTILKCMNGIIKPRKGQVLLDGRDVQDMSLKERASIFGYVPQNTSANPCLNVLETVVSGRMVQMKGRASHSDFEAAEHILEEMGLTEFAMRPLHELSGGERQRVLIARALAQNPKIILLDEPTSNLDLYHQLNTFDLLTETAKKRDIMVIIIVHDLNFAIRYSDRIVLLADRKLKCMGNGMQVVTKSTMRDIFNVDVAFADVHNQYTMVPVKGCERKVI